MPVPTGAASFQDIQDEHGGAHPIALNEYYGVDTGVPGSGAISVDDLRGTSSNPVVTEGSSGAAGNGSWGYNESAAYGSVTGKIAGQDIEAIVYSEFTVKSSQTNNFAVTVDGLHASTLFTSITLLDTSGDPVLLTSNATHSQADGKTTWTWNGIADYSAAWNGSGTQEVQIA